MNDESNRLSARAARFARVGANVGGVAARIAATKLMGMGNTDAGSAAALRQALGSLKGPLMKVAQMLATIPDALPAEYAEELSKLQSDAPPMGGAFVKRRMQAELGPDWQARFQSFDLKPSAAASLGQVHRARSTDGRDLACKLQYPDMASAVEADLQQLDVIFALHRRFKPAIDTREITKEIAERIREELDYGREAKHARLYKLILGGSPDIRVPEIETDLSTAKLITMEWLEGEKLLTFKGESEAVRNRIGAALYKAWWKPFNQYGVIHGDPHLGNYTVFRDAPQDGAKQGVPQGINLLDYGCVRIFPASFVGGVSDLYQGLLHNEPDRVVHAYETWGFRGLTKDLIEALNIWARFIYGPLLEDRVRSIADGIEPGKYGRKEAFRTQEALQKYGPVTVPREFVFMDRAAIGLGSVFLHLDVKMNFHRMFNEEIAGFDVAILAKRQAEALTKVGLSGLDH
jgi:predicted unusual protein kinase regulating ubiquinone biosynthesis (AarF/ABC1/UbiB family)